MKKKRRMISNLILILSLAVFCVSAYKLYGIFSEYKKGEEEYNSLKEQALQTEEAEEPVQDKSEEMEKNEPDKQEIVKVDFAYLQKINRDVVAWIRFDEPSGISYPVVWSDDNNKYIHTTFEGKKNSAGTLFVDAEDNGGFTGRNTFIHGHNMKNGSMFGELDRYKKESFCKKYPFFYIHTPDGKVSTYQIFAACVVKDDSETYHRWYNTDEGFAEYIRYVRSVSRYQVDIEVGTDAKIVSLSTCTNVTEDERFVVHGVKVSEGVQ